MMEELGFQVIPFGYEKSLRELNTRGTKLKGPASEQIRFMPDFVIVNKKTDDCFFIEVKSSKKGGLEPDWIENTVKNYPKAHILLIEPDRISIAKAGYIRKHCENEEPFCYLTEFGPFKDCDKRIIVKYVRKTKEVFG